jgi:hypothetical protein
MSTNDATRARYTPELQAIVAELERIRANFEHFRRT